jgi:antitoxin MazE
MLIQLNKWGNSIGLRIPKELRDELELSEGSEVSLRIEDKKMILEPAKKKKVKKDSLEHWVEEFTKDINLEAMVKQNSRMLKNPISLGRPVGKERW